MFNRQKTTLPTNAAAYVGKVSFDAIMAGAMLSDVEVNAAQVILKIQFPHIPGMQDTLLGSTLAFNVITNEFIQILHDSNLHWLLMSTFGCTDGQVNIYDSLMSPPSLQVQLQIASLLCSSLTKMQCAYQSWQQQKGGADCGLFAIAFAVDICLLSVRPLTSGQLADGYDPAVIEAKSCSNIAKTIND